MFYKSPPKIKKAGFYNLNKLQNCFPVISTIVRSVTVMDIL